MWGDSGYWALSGRARNRLSTATGGGFLLLWGLPGPPRG